MMDLNETPFIKLDDLVTYGESLKDHLRLLRSLLFVMCGSLLILAFLYLNSNNAN